MPHPTGGAIDLDVLLGERSSIVAIADAVTIGVEGNRQPG
jgi:hypothetical protein